jgi:hypothetical protein
MAIKLNLAYKYPLAYKEGKIEFVLNNLLEYDIHPWYADGTTGLFGDIKVELPINIDTEERREILDKLWLYSGQNFQQHVQHDNIEFEIYTLEDALNETINFIYPFVIYNNDIFHKYETIELDKELVEACKDGRCKIVFSQITEGFIGQGTTHHYEWIDRLCKKYELPKKSLLLVSANLKITEVYPELVKKGIIDDTFTPVEYSQFNDNLWFSNTGVVTWKIHRDILVEQFYQNLQSESRLNKEKHFICFNRVPKNHRTFIYGELNSHPDLVGKSISSLGGMNVFDNMRIPHDYEITTYYNWMNDFLPLEYKHGKRRILKFYKDHNSYESIVYDEPDMWNNKAESLNVAAHNKAFLNIITESLTNHEAIFFSEKTFKPIFLAQPFIMAGNPHSLKKLKEMGYKTFDKWWDESYDSEEEELRRYEKIVDSLLEISSWDLDKCNQVLKEMEPILIHNFEVMISGNPTNNLIQILNEW